MIQFIMVGNLRLSINASYVIVVAYSGKKGEIIYFVVKMFEVLKNVYMLNVMIQLKIYLNVK